jgi:hypothetical protein
MYFVVNVWDFPLILCSSVCASGDSGDTFLLPQDYWNNQEKTENWIFAQFVEPGDLDLTQIGTKEPFAMTRPLHETYLTKDDNSSMASSMEDSGYNTQSDIARPSARQYSGSFTTSTQGLQHYPGSSILSPTLSAISQGSFPNIQTSMNYAPSENSGDLNADISSLSGQAFATHPGYGFNVNNSGFDQSQWNTGGIHLNEQFSQPLMGTPHCHTHTPRESNLSNNQFTVNVDDDFEQARHQRHSSVAERSHRPNVQLDTRVQGASAMTPASANSMQRPHTSRNASSQSSGFQTLGTGSVMSPALSESGIHAVIFKTPLYVFRYILLHSRSNLLTLMIGVQ